MAHPMWRRVEPIVAELGRNPLYRASGAAMELFHSNVLAWVLRTHPAASAPLALLLGVAPADEYDVRREWLHTDLAVGVDGARPGAVVENKITARSDPRQLDEYRAAVEKAAPDFAQHADYVLLSLLAPIFELPGRWRHVDYARLASAMDEVARGLSGFDADFARQYGHLTRLLADLVVAAGIGTTPTEAYFLDPATDHLLRQAGARDLVLKLRNVDLVQRVIAKKTYGSEGWHEALWTNGQPIASRFTRQIEVPGLGSTHLGWQMQGQQLRIVALLHAERLYGKGPSLKAAREDAAQRYLEEWFDTDLLRSFAPRHLSAYAGKRSYNHFDPDFIYRYGKLSPNIPSVDLVGALAALSRAAEDQLSRLATPRGEAAGVPA